MKLFLKIFLGIISIFGLILLISHTFISGENYENEYKNYFLGKDSLGFLENGTITNNPSHSGSIQVQNIGHLNKVFFSSGSVKKEGSIISITKGIYVFDFKQSNNYTIVSDGFRVENDGPGIFIIHNLEYSKIKFFPLTTILNLSFVHPTSKKILTTTQIYPNFTITINAVKNIFLQNADFFKIQLLYPIGYWEKPLFRDQTISQDFLARITTEPNDILWLEKTMLYLQKNILNANSEISKYSSATFLTLFGEGLLKEYNSLLLNPKKDTTYQKNQILKDFFNINTKNNSQSILFLEKKLLQLKIKSSTDYEEIENILAGLCYEIMSSKETSFSQKQNCNQLFGGKPIPKSVLSIQSTYTNYHFSFIENILFSDIEKFLKYFYTDYQLENTKTSIHIEALLYMMSNILLTQLNQVSDQNEINSVASLLEYYSQLATSGKVSSNKNQIQTSLYNNSAIIIQIKKMLLQLFFLDQKNSFGLYEKNIDMVYSVSTIKQLQASIQVLLDFLTNNESLLRPLTNDKDKSLQNIYKINQKQLSELFLALIDYNIYSREYDTNKRDLIQAKTLLELQSNQQVLSLEDAQAYLQQFVGINTRNMKIALKDYEFCSLIEKGMSESEYPNYCYYITGLQQNNQSIDFVLLPFESHTLTQMVINQTARSGEYVLDEIELELEERRKSSVQSNNNNLNFSYFFVNTFQKQNSSSSENFKSEIEIITTEDKTISNFKRNKLFGTGGDFQIISDIFTINYNDVRVQRDQNDFSILIDLAVFDIKHPNRNARNIIGSLESRYDFTTHKFYNVSLNYYRKPGDTNSINTVPIVLGETLDAQSLKTKIIELYLAGFKK